MNEIEIRRYVPSDKNIWDDYVESSKNGTFLFKRDYMDYHADRFNDNSFLIYRKGRLYCLLPACRIEDTVSSHAGLTYGGLIMNEKCTAEGILLVFSVLLDKLKKEGCRNFIYKSVPYIYHSLPSEEDLYALFRFKASLAVRNISTTIDRKNPVPYNRLRRRNIIKSESNHITIEESDNWDYLWKIVENNLKERYDVAPVHNLEEIRRLASLFPENIKLYCARENNSYLAAGVIYITKNVVHAQYIHATPQGKEKGAVDALVNHLLLNEFTDRRYFDFGNSNEDQGRYLNESLIHMKEGFGGRAVCYDTYQINLFYD